MKESFVGGVKGEAYPFLLEHDRDVFAGWHDR